MSEPQAPFTGAETEALIRWSGSQRPDLPWRGERDPWRVLIAEVMLQQTAATRVVDRWPAFVERFDTPRAMADASVGEVIAAWQGLGYNRRAVALHRCATAVVADHGGSLPSDPVGLAGLPGVGPYTARAVAAFAFGVDVGALDTNVGRVLARRSGRRLTPAEAQTMADAAVPSGRAGAWNQALFDLGALVCTARSPDCTGCCVADGCAWRGEGPDPATDSAGVSRPQPPLAGSDREGRARLVRALAAGDVVEVRAVADVMGWPGDSRRADAVLAGLVADGLVTVADGRLSLPG